MSHLIDLRNLYVSYGDFPVLNDVTLQISNHEFVGVVGPTGCGKTTLLNLISGVLQIKGEATIKGRALFDGKPILRPNRHCGIVWQDYSLFPDKPIWKNIAAGPIYEHYTPLDRLLRFTGYGAGVKRIRNEVIELMKIAGLPEHHAYKKPHQLSGGQRQRVAILRSIINNPKALMEDEPHGALDPGTRTDMQEFQSKVFAEEKDKSFFFITHSVQEAITMATRLIVLSPYYKGNESLDKGATIVLDLKIPVEHPRSREFAYTDLFVDTLKMVDEFGLDKDVFQELDASHFTHPDAVMPDFK